MGIFSGVFGSSNIEGRKYDKELEKNLSAQQGIAGDLLAAESEYRPQYQELGLGLLRDAFGGGSLYSDFLGGLASAEAEGDTVAGQADLDRRSRLTSQARDQLTASNPLLAALEAESLSEVGSYDLPPGLQRELEQDYRANRARMGLGHGLSDAIGEAGMLASTRYQINQQNRNRAQSVAGQVSPLMEALLAARGPSISEGSQGIGVASGFNPGSLFNPESSYAEGVRAGNNATRNAVTAQQEGMGFGIVQGAGQLAAGGLSGGLSGGFTGKSIGQGMLNAF